MGKNILIEDVELNCPEVQILRTRVDFGAPKYYLMVSTVQDMFRIARYVTAVFYVERGDMENPWNSKEDDTQLWGHVAHDVGEARENHQKAIQSIISTIKGDGKV